MTRERRLFTVVAAVILVDTAFYAAITPLLPTYEDDLGLTKGEVGVLSASYAAGTLGASIPAAFLAARIGVRAALFAGLALLAASSLTFAFADDFALLAGARFAQGVGGACAWTAGLAWLLASAPKEERGVLIGSVLAVAIAGIVLGPVIGGIATEAGAEPVFSVVSVLAVGLAVATAGLPAVAPEPPPPARRIVAIMLARPLMVAFWLVALPSVLSGLGNVLIALRLDDLGASGVTIGAVFLIAAVVEATLTPAIGAFSDRSGRMLPLRAGLVACAVAAIILPLPATVFLLGLVTVAVVLAMALMWTPAMALMSDEADSAGLDLAFAAALVNISWAGGQVLGGSAGAALADATSDGLAYGAVAALFAVTAAAMLATRRRPLAA